MMEWNMAELNHRNTEAGYGTFEMFEISEGGNSSQHHPSKSRKLTKILAVDIDQKKFKNFTEVYNFSSPLCGNADVHNLTWLKNVLVLLTDQSSSVLVIEYSQRD
jgi:hypothetical protein